MMDINSITTIGRVVEVKKALFFFPTLIVIDYTFNPSVDSMQDALKVAKEHKIPVFYEWKGVGVTVNANSNIGALYLTLQDKMPRVSPYGGITYRIGP